MRICIYEIKYDFYFKFYKLKFLNFCHVFFFFPGDIDRCLKKVDEGVETFEDIWKKVVPFCSDYNRLNTPAGFQLETFFF